MSKVLRLAVKQWVPAPLTDAGEWAVQGGELLFSLGLGTEAPS